MSKKVAEATIRGKQVSFFTPPHNEPDFLWVDMEELARAFVLEEDVSRMVDHARKLNPDDRVYATARNGDRIATIVCHAMAQGFCGFIDHLNGYSGNDMQGPAHTDYCFAAAEVEGDYGAHSFEGIVAAFNNNGGPFMRDLREPAKDDVCGAAPIETTSHPDVRYSAIKEFEPTILGQVISVSAGKHASGRETLAILMIPPEGCEESFAVLAEYDAGAIPLETMMVAADFARRAAGHACRLVSDTDEPMDLGESGEVIHLPPCNPEGGAA